MIALHRPGTSLLHRMPAWAKLLALVVIGTALSLAVPERGAVVLAWLLGGAAVLVVGGFLIARFGPAELGRQLWALRWLLVIMVLPQLIFLGPAAALVNTSRMVLLLLFAALLTLTTPMAALLEVLERCARPLALVRIPPARVALLLALTISTVPVIGGLFAQVREAQRARGVRGAWRPVVPLLVLSLRHADELGDALRARGVD